MKGLKIQVDFTTGKRAGGKLNHKDKNLPCNPLWQNTETGEEIRMVVDGKVGPYTNIPGVEILNGQAAIDAAVAGIQPAALTTYTITSEALLGASLRARRNLDAVIQAGGEEQNVLAQLHQAGALGIAANTRKPPTAEGMAKCWECK